VCIKDSCWSVGTIYDPIELPGVSIAGPGIWTWCNRGDLRVGPTGHRERERRGNWTGCYRGGPRVGPTGHRERGEGELGRRRLGPGGPKWPMRLGFRFFCFLFYLKI
jgi:hypothetical protein